MKYIKYIPSIILAALLAASCQPKHEAANNSHTNSALDARIDSVLQLMDIDDKIGEMTQLSIDMVSDGQPYNLTEPHRLVDEKLQEVLVKFRVGSILNCGGHAYSREHWQEIITKIQEVAATKKTKIPVLYGIDAIHGVNYTTGSTLYPQQLAQASTFNTAMATKLAQICAYETRASFIPWDFSPVLDVGRDARWPRLWESYGEDVHLVTQMGLATIKGYQGDDMNHPEHVAACLKHFFGYSLPLIGRDRTTAYIPERQLREYFLPPFAEAIKNGAMTVMVNSGDIAGIPVHTSKDILHKILREELGFDGLAVTDWEDIRYLFSRHKVAANYKEAIKMSIDAGIDMSMVPVDLEFPVLLKELVTEGQITEARLNESVRRILRVKFMLGLFDQPYFKDHDYSKFGSEEFAQTSFEAATEAIILAKNNNATLPITAAKKILVCGPTAASLNCLNGGWTHTWQGTDAKYNTPGKLTTLEAIQKEFGAAEIRYVQGSSHKTAVDIAAARKEANWADVVIVCLGEDPYTEKLGDRPNLILPDAQFDLVKELSQAKKPMVGVFIEGRPRIFNEVESMLDAVLVTFLPGNEGGRAIAAVLSGAVNPSAKMPVTYPKAPNDLVTYDHPYTTAIDTSFGSNGFQPQYAFGHGLSYTTFAYSNLTCDSAFGASDSIRIKVDVKNTGSVAGKEAVLVYVTDEVASVTPSVKRLRAFSKETLAAGESKTVTFTLHSTELAFVGRENTWITEPGTFTLHVGDLHKAFIVK